MGSFFLFLIPRQYEIISYLSQKGALDEFLR